MQIQEAPGEARRSKNRAEQPIYGKRITVFPWQRAPYFMVLTLGNDSLGTVWRGRVRFIRREEWVLVRVPFHYSYHLCDSHSLAES